MSETESKAPPPHRLLVSNVRARLDRMRRECVEFEHALATGIVPGDKRTPLDYQRNVQTLRDHLMLYADTITQDLTLLDMERA